MHDVSLSRRSALALALAALAIPTVADARRLPLGAPPATANKLAEQTIELSDRGVIWQMNSLQSLDSGSPAWPFHAGFLAALDAPLTVLDGNGETVSEVSSGTALPVAEKSYLLPTAAASDSPYLAIEIVGQDDSDSRFRRPFKVIPGQYMLTLWSLAADAGSDADIASLLAENLKGAPVMLAVIAGGVAIESKDGDVTGQLLQGSWDAIDTDSIVTVPGGVSSQLLIATIAAVGQGGDNDLGAGSASASTTSSPSSVVTTSFPGVFQVNYRTASLDAGDLTWRVVSGVATQEPSEVRYQRGFIAALNGAIALTEEDGTFRRIGGGNAITVRNGDRFSSQSLTTTEEPFIAIELLAGEDASDPGALTFPILDGKFTFELWRVALQEANIDAFRIFMQDSPFPSLFFIQRGQVQVKPAGGAEAQSLTAGASQVIAPGATFALTGPSSLILIGRLLPL